MSRRRRLPFAALAALLAGAGLAGAPAGGARAQDTALSDRAKALDANGNGVIERDEARGPLAESFDAIDTDKSGTLDGAEIRAFFQGGGARAAAPGRGPAGGGGGRPPALVAVDPVIVEPSARTLPVIGRLIARQSADVAVEIRGVVVEMRVDVGDRVARGDVMVRIARDRLKAERDRQAAAVERNRGMVATAEAELRKKEGELERLDRLQDSAAFSRARYDDLVHDVQSRRGALDERRAQLREAEALLLAAQIDLADSVIKAPFPGVVTAKHVDVGAYLAVGARVVSLLNDTDLEVEAEVPSDRLAGLAAGTPVRLRLDDGSEHPGEVRAIVPSDNVRTRTRPVRFTPRFGATARPLAANQSVTVLMPAGIGHDVVTVHKDAVVRSGEDAFVYVVEGEAARRAAVRLGEAVGSRFIVLDGVKPGDRVVVRGNETLGRGGAVRVSGGLGG